MTPDQVKEAIRLLGGLFPSQVTQEQAKLLREQLAPFAWEAAAEAIKAHRAGREFWNYPQLLEGCRAAERSEKASRDNAGSEGTWCDVHRRQNPQLAGRSDLEVVLRVHRGWWVRCNGSEAYRNKFTTDCRYALVQHAGVKAEDAEAWANLIFEDVPTFAMALEDLRGNLPGGRAA